MNSISNIRQWNRHNLEAVNIQAQWDAGINADGVKVIRGTGGEHGEYVDLIMQTHYEGIQTVYHARNIIDAVEYAKANNIKLINYSRYEHTKVEESWEYLNTMPDDIIICAAAGNNGTHVYFPANHPNVFAFSNWRTDRNELSRSSNYGPEVFLTAPGFWEIVKGKYIDGTSYSTPVGTAIIAGFQKKFKELTGRHPKRLEVRSFLRHYAKKLAETDKDKVGHGMLSLPDPQVWINEIKRGGKLIMPELPEDVRHRDSAEDVALVIEEGLMQGFPDGTFRPDQPLTREQYAITLARMIRQGRL